MSRTEIAELTVLCLISDGDKVLLQNRVKEDWEDNDSGMSKIVRI